MFDELKIHLASRDVFDELKIHLTSHKSLDLFQCSDFIRG